MLVITFMFLMVGDIQKLKKKAVLYSTIRLHTPSPFSSVYVFCQNTIHFFFASETTASYCFFFSLRPCLDMLVLIFFSLKISVSSFFKRAMYVELQMRNSILANFLFFMRNLVSFCMLTKKSYLQSSEMSLVLEFRQFNKMYRCVFH